MAYDEEKSWRLKVTFKRLPVGRKFGDEPRPPESDKARPSAGSIAIRGLQKALPES